MGETGCGKTRLIRYMCKLAKNTLDVKNMFIMKVHMSPVSIVLLWYIPRALHFL